MEEIAPDVRTDLERRVAAELGRRVAAWTPVWGGKNNRLFRLETDHGPLAAKLYRRSPWLEEFYRRSGGDGLTREFGSLTLLRERGLTAVPRPFLRSPAHGYAVYSFEPGAAPRPADLGPDQMGALGRLAAAVHDFGPDDAAADLPPAIEAGFALADQVAAVRNRLDGLAPAPAGAGDPARALLDELGLPAEIARRLELATAGLTEAELAAPLPRSAWRLNSSDFCVVNLLVDGPRLVVVDWEWSGWDDPARMVVGFAAHAGSDGLPPAAAAAFLRAYAAARRLPEAEWLRFGRVAGLIEAFWLAALPGVLTPEALAARRFAVPDFDEAAQVAEVRHLVGARLARPPLTPAEWCASALG